MELVESKGVDRISTVASASSPEEPTLATLGIPRVSGVLPRFTFTHLSYHSLCAFSTRQQEVASNSFHSMASSSHQKIPILLLKTKSSPVDTYEEYFSTFDNGRYDPVFVPVLEHRFQEQTLTQVRHDIMEGAFVSGPGGTLPQFGAIIFTSQRAVEAFSVIVNGIRASRGTDVLDRLIPERLPLYVVGPATARGLRALHLQCPILGEETGNGDLLATFILDHYNGLYNGPDKPPILFLVGDKRRDIIPKTLQSLQLEPERRARVDELVIYETVEMQSFKSDFSKLWKSNKGLCEERQWVVVFSPTGCKAMLDSLGALDVDTGRVKSGLPMLDVHIATIGPTTRDFLMSEFGFTPDVCAEKPSPEGIATGLQQFFNQ